jgi:PAS domain S-box-containing protein
MTSKDEVNVSRPPDTRELSDSVIAMFDEEGTVVAWTQAAEQLVGHPAGDVVGHPFTRVVPFRAHAPTTAAFLELCSARNGWSGTTAVRHRDGHMFDLGLRVRGRDARVQWLPRHLPTEQAALKCVYMAVMSLDPTGAGRKRWTMRWKGAMNAFDLAFDGRLTAGQL